MQPPQHQYVAAMAVIVLAQCIAVSQFSLTKQPACSSIMVFTRFIDKQWGEKREMDLDSYSTSQVY